MQNLPEITYYCNASGETFLHENGTVKNCSSTKLPYPLQEIYYRYWFNEGSGMLNYLVSIDGKYGLQYGLLLVKEYNMTDKQSNSDMDSLFDKTIRPTASIIENSLSLFCPEAEVYVGNQTGFNECHEIAVFFPYKTPEKNMARGLFVLNEFSSENRIPVSEDVFDTSQYKRFLDYVLQFKGNRTISKHYKESTSKQITVRFQDKSNVIADINIITETDETPETLIASLQNAIEEIKRSAADAGLYYVNTEDIIFLSCSAIVPDRWEYQASPEYFVHL